MADDFKWKAHKDIWKGVGIYHITFVVSGRKRLLGELVAEYPGGDTATVKRSLYTNTTEEYHTGVEENAKMIGVHLTPYGKAVDDMLRHYDETHEGITVCKRIVMDDHLHIVLWVKKQQYSTVQHKPLSILQIAYGMRIQFTHMAQDMGIWPKGVRVEGALHAEKGAGHIFEKQFVRTLSRKGQLRSMIDYVTLNPYRKYSKRQHPELFTMHKDTEMKGLHFRSMGNHWLLDWPERQVVECSRDISEEDLQRLMKQVMKKAEMGAVTYTAAKSKGEQRIARSIREAGWPLVVLMLDGFPPAGSDNERYYKPGGVYFDACKNGKLLLLEAHESNYDDQRIVNMTEAELKRKDQEKSLTPSPLTNAEPRLHSGVKESTPTPLACTSLPTRREETIRGRRPLPHSSKRWRMIAGNVMLKMIAGSPRPPRSAMPLRSLGQKKGEEAKAKAGTKTMEPKNLGSLKLLVLNPFLPSPSRK